MCTGSARSPGRFNQLLQQATCLRICLYIWRYGVLGPNPLEDYDKIVEFANAHWFVHTEDLAMWFSQYTLNNDSNTVARELLCVFKQTMLQTKKCGRATMTRNTNYYQIKLNEDYTSTSYNIYNFDEQAVKVAMNFRTDDKLAETIKILSDMTNPTNMPMIRADKGTHQLFIYESLMNYVMCDGERNVLRAHAQIIKGLLSQNDTWLNENELWVITDPVEIARFGFPDAMIAGVDCRKSGDKDYEDAENKPLDTEPGYTHKETTPVRCMYAGLLEANCTLGEKGIFKNVAVSVPNAVASKMRGKKLGPDGPHHTRFEGALLYSKELLGFADVDTTACLMHGVIRELSKLRTTSSIAMLNSHPILINPPADRTCEPITITNSRYIPKELRMQSGMGVDQARSMFKNDVPSINWSGLKPGQSIDDSLSNMMFKTAYNRDCPPEWLPSNIEKTLKTKAKHASPNGKLKEYTNFDTDADDCTPLDADKLLFL